MQGSDKLHLMSKSIPHPIKTRKGRYSPQEPCPRDGIRKTKPPQTQAWKQIIPKCPKRHGDHARDEVSGTNTQHRRMLKSTQSREHKESPKSQSPTIKVSVCPFPLLGNILMITVNKCQLACVCVRPHALMCNKEFISLTTAIKMLHQKYHTNISQELSHKF